jgi:oligopeptide transport system substrate-binding protein
VVAALAAIAALSVSGCDDAASPYFGGARRVGRDARTFHVNNGGEPEFLDPSKCADAGCSVLCTQLFEGLTRHHPGDAHPVQGVARSWDRSDDNRLYRFHLRPDARWSDGRPVTAGDFEYAWKRALRPATASRAAGNVAVLLNGELFRLGKLKALRADGPLLGAPRAGAPAGARLARGTAVRVMERAGGFARVERWSKLPAYGAPPPAPLAEPATTGWIAETDLVEDAGVVGVRATDDVTLEVELERPTPYFLDLTSLHALSPVRRDVVEPFEQRGEADLWTRPESMVSNGPYMLDRWAFQYEIDMKDNPFYWDRDKLAIRRIVWMEVQDYHASMNLYKAGELDYLGDSVPPPAEYQALLADKKDYVRNDALSVYWYELNTRKPPLDDVRVRRALDRAIDKQQIVERIARGGQKPATHYVPDFTGAGYAEQAAADRAAGVDPFADLGFDPAAARALLAEAGFAPVREGDGWRAPGFPPLTMLYNTGEGHRQIAVAVQAMWKENLGITVATRNVEWKVMLKASADGDFQMVRTGQTAEYDHPNTFLEGLRANNPQNRTGWHDDVFERTLDRAAATADRREGIRLYREAEHIAAEAVPRIPFYFYTRTTMVKPWVKGFRGSKRNPHAIQFLSIDPAWQADGPSAPDVFAYEPPELPPPGPFLRPSAEPAPP